MSITTMKQALEALEMSESLLRGDYNMTADVCNKSITSLHQAIAEAERQEPVAWFGFNEQGECREVFTQKMRKMFPNYPTEGMTPVYTSPPQRQWVGLTEEEIVGCWARRNMWQIAHAIESKLKEKNT